MNHLKRIATTAGLSVLLTTGALAQDSDQEVNLADIEVDSISITAADGSVLFNHASNDTSSETTPSGLSGVKQRGQSNGQTQPAARAGRGGTRGAETASAPIELDDMEDCVELSSEFVSKAIEQSGASRSARGRAAAPNPNADEFSDFTAKCFNDGEEVGTITFSEDGTPTVQLSGMDGP